MKHILARGALELLAQIAWSHSLLAFDFDGTLAPIVPDRAAARMRPATAALLGRLCRQYPCAIISGRSVADLASHLGPIRFKYVIGNHGLEPGASIESFAHDVAVVRPQLARALGSLQGVEIEDKRYSLAVHYRRSRQKVATCRAIYAAVRALFIPMRIVAGKLVVNVIPESAPHKGDALVRLRDLEGADTALYLGDDVTDEDVFEIDQPGRLLSIRVGHSRSSAAPYYLRNQHEVDALLGALSEARGRGRRR